jgi:formyltetrahydrofolate synthetase
MVGFGLPVVVAINRFPYDTPEEIEVVKRYALAAGAVAAVESMVHAKGGEGGADLARAVVEACKQPSDFKFLYDLDSSIKEKIETIATKIYGAEGVDYEPEAEKKIKLFEAQGLGNLPICMAKTHLSLSHDPNLKGRPTGFRLPVRDIRPSVGAGFLYPLCGTMSTMPGLPSRPAAVDVGIDEQGNVVGLF